MGWSKCSSRSLADYQALSGWREDLVLEGGGGGGDITENNTCSIIQSSRQTHTYMYIHSSKVRDIRS